MDKSSHEEHLSHPLQINNKEIKKAVIFQSASINVFNITEKNNKFYFMK